MIEQMQPGPELDAAVAAALGWTRVYVEDENRIWGCPPGLDVNGERRVPAYSTHIVVAWQVVERLSQKGWNWSLSRDCGLCGETETKGDMSYRFVLAAPNLPMAGFWAPTAPHAISLAALAALGAG